MAPHTLLITRATDPKGRPFSHRQVLVMPEAELPAPVLAWICCCPTGAVTATRIGPIWLAHGGLWGEEHSEPSFHWPLLGGTIIHGRACAIVPDHHSGGWQALSEHQAHHADGILWRYGLPLMPSLQEAAA
ncbi:hypothetical protein KBY93_12460 [Synechococcus sp. J7-Johnson]|nr:hypothetical protein [Synechococcus sp. J7-Johnson]